MVVAAPKGVEGEANRTLEHGPQGDHVENEGDRHRVLRGAVFQLHREGGFPNI